METAKGFLYFTGQFYRRSKTKKGTLDALGPYRLWRIRPDGTGLKALTDSKHDALMTPRFLMAPWLGIVGRSFRDSSHSYVPVSAQCLQIRS